MVKGVILDLDGTVYLGERIIPGAERAVARLRESGMAVLFLSNKTIEDPANYAAKLTRLGIPAGADAVLNSTVMTAAYLKAHSPGARVFILGEEPLRRAVLNAGMEEAERPSQTDVVLVSLDRGMTYDKIHFAYHAARHGARVLATNPDMICPMDGESLVDAGAWIAALEALLARPIDDVLGKPSARTAETACARLGLETHEAAMVGDRLETDILMGRNAGMVTALVLTGVTDRKRVAASTIEPDHVLDSLADLPAALGIAEERRVG